MGWLHVIGSLKLYVSFAKEPYERDDILPKRHVILSSLLIVATPYQRREYGVLRIHVCAHTHTHMFTRTQTCVFTRKDL